MKPTSKGSSSNWNSPPPPQIGWLEGTVAYVEVTAIVELNIPKIDAVSHYCYIQNENPESSGNKGISWRRELHRNKYRSERTCNCRSEGTSKTDPWSSASISFVLPHSLSLRPRFGFCWFLTLLGSPYSMPLSLKLLVLSTFLFTFMLLVTFFN